MDLFLLPIRHWQEFWLATLAAGGFVVVFLLVAKPPERRSSAIRWVRAITGPNGKFLFGALFMAWLIGMAVLVPVFPDQANSPYGSIALIGLFAGFFIMMGFLWSVIGE